MNFSSRDISISAILLGTSAFLATNFFSSRVIPSLPSVASSQAESTQVGASNNLPPDTPNDRTIIADASPTTADPSQIDSRPNENRSAEAVSRFSTDGQEFMVETVPPAVAGKGSDSIVFSCDRRESDLKPITYAYVNGEKLPLILWAYTFFESEEPVPGNHYRRATDAGLRCEEAAKNLQYWNDRLGSLQTQITTGLVDDQPVVCVAVEDGYPCNRDSILWEVTTHDSLKLNPNKHDLPVGIDENPTQVLSTFFGALVREGEMLVQSGEHPMISLETLITRAQAE